MPRKRQSPQDCAKEYPDDLHVQAKQRKSTDSTETNDSTLVLCHGDRRSKWKEILGQDSRAHSIQAHIRFKRYTKLKEQYV